jgi:hypothetical protein
MHVNAFSITFMNDLTLVEHDQAQGVDAGLPAGYGKSRNGSESMSRKF